MTLFSVLVLFLRPLLPEVEQQMSQFAPPKQVPTFIPGLPKQVQRNMTWFWGFPESI